MLSIYSRGTLWELAVELGTGSFTLVLGVPLFSSPYVWLSGFLPSYEGALQSFPDHLASSEGRVVSYQAHCPWDSPGKNTGVGHHFLLQGIFWPRNRTRVPCISCTAGGFFTTKPPGKPSTFGSISQMVVVQWLSRVWLFAAPWTAARQASLSLTISWSLLKFMSI